MTYSAFCVIIVTLPSISIAKKLDLQNLEDGPMTGNLASLLFGDATVEEVEQASDGDNKVIAWINANPPDLPKHQNNCAACGKHIPVHDTDWVILGDGALIHYSGQHGRSCWDRWHQMRREEAAYKTLM